MHSNINLLMKLLASRLGEQATLAKSLVMRDSVAGSGGARDPGPRSGKLTCTPHLRHVTGEASRLREPMLAALPAPGYYATPGQSGGSLCSGLPTSKPLATISVAMYKWKNAI